MSEARRIRSFRCADTLWRALEDESDERGITVDALITEALWSYLRAAPDYASQSSQSARLDAMMLAAARDAHRRSDSPSATGVGFAGESSDAQGRIPAHHLAGAERRRALRHEESDQTVNNLQLVYDEQGNLRVPPTDPDYTTDLPNFTSPSSDVTTPRQKISLNFSGTRYPVTGDRFLIGRASTGTDLQIRDANVSRKHAAVIHHDGGWFIHDLQSTNGVEFRGRRIHTRRIEHLDRYTICDYELVFEFED